MRARRDREHGMQGWNMKSDLSDREEMQGWSIERAATRTVIVENQP